MCRRVLTVAGSVLETQSVHLQASVFRLGTLVPLPALWHFNGAGIGVLRTLTPANLVHRVKLGRTLCESFASSQVCRTRHWLGLSGVPRSCDRVPRQRELATKNAPTLLCDQLPEQRNAKMSPCLSKSANCRKPSHDQLASAFVFKAFTVGKSRAIWASVRTCARVEGANRKLANKRERTLAGVIDSDASH